MNSILFCLFLFTLFPFCTYGQQSPKRPSEEEVFLEKAFIEASREKILGNYQEAISRYREVTQKYTSNPVAHYELSRLYILLEQYDQATIQIERSVELESSNKTYIQLYAFLLKKQGNYIKATKVFQDLLNKYPKEKQLYYDLGFFLEKSGQLNQALKLYSTMEKRLGIQPQISINKHAIYARQGKHKKAIYELERLATTYPEEPKYAVAVAKWYEQTNLPDKARVWYGQVLKISPNHPDANVFMATIFLVEQKDTVQYLKALSSLFADPNQDVAAKLQAINPIFESAVQNDKQQSLLTQLAQKLSTAHPNNYQAHLIHGQLLFQQHQYEAAAQAFNRSLTLNKNKLSAWEYLLEAYLHSGQISLLLKTSKTVMEIYPNHAIGYYFCAMANYRRANYQKAIETAKQAIFMAASVPKLQGKLYSILARSYYENKDPDAADKTFEEALNILRESPDVLSSYAHYLASRNIRLNDATQMAKEAVKLSPNKTTYQTAYAWVLHQQGNYVEAREWFEKALKNGGEESPETLEKYGDTLYQLNDSENALAYWKLARIKGADSDRLSKKITTKQLNPK